MNNITKEINEQIQKILEKDENITFAILHGSYLINPHFKDIDIALFLEPNIKHEFANYYEVELPIYLMREIKVSIDISILNNSSFGFKYQTLKGKILFCRDYEKYYQYAEEILRVYLDYQPLITKALEYL